VWVVSTTTATTHPAIFADFQNVDTLSTPATTTVKGSALRTGMVLVDDLGCPVAGLDGKLPTVRNSGAVRFLVADLDRGGWTPNSFHANKRFTVVAK
jgi:hypothetical protein